MKRALAMMIICSGFGLGTAEAWDTYEPYQLAIHGEPRSVHLGEAIPGLYRIEMRYLKSDHHVRQIQFGQDLPGDGFDLWLRDSSSKTPYEAYVGYVDLSEVGTQHFTEGDNCFGGECWLLIPELECGETIVLSGFTVELVKGSDMHLLELEVMPYPDMGMVHVVFRDNDGAEPFNVKLAYVVIPSDLVRYRRLMTTWGNQGEVSRTDGIAVIQGFRLSFKEHDNHLRHFKVDLGTGSWISMALYDGDGIDDPWEGEVKYVILED